MTLPWATKEIRKWEAMFAEAEELVRILGKALDLVPVRAIKSGLQWLPSDEAVNILGYAKDRLNEWRMEQS